MKTKAGSNSILTLMRNAFIALIINVIIALLIYFIFHYKGSHQFGVILGVIGAVYFVPLLGFLSSDMANKSNMAFDTSLMSSRTVRRERIPNEISLNIKSLVYGILTLAVSYLFSANIINF